MTDNPRGLYEVLITEAIAQQLEQLDARLYPLRFDLRSAEAADRIALHLSRIIARAVESVPEGTRVEAGIALARGIIATTPSAES